MADGEEQQQEQQEASLQGETSSILDFATKESDGAAENAGDWKAPEDLGLPEHLVGTSADETLAKLAKAYSGARRELSQKGKAEGALEGSVPDSPDGYVFEAEGDDDSIAAELNSEASKPIVDAFRNAAHKLGIPDKAFTDLMRMGMQGVSEAGIPLGVSNEDAQKISGEAEMAALTKEVGAKEAGTIVNTISNFGKKLAQNGVLADEADVAEFAEMVGTARAARIFHRLLVANLGEKPIPAAIGADGAVTPMEAQAAHSAALRMPPGPEKDVALQDAMRKLEKAFGNDPAPGGRVKSSVL